MKRPKRSNVLVHLSILILGPFSSEDYISDVAVSINRIKRLCWLDIYHIHHTKGTCHAV